jgi:hypothetical protein
VKQKFKTIPTLGLFFSTLTLVACTLWLSYASAQHVPIDERTAAATLDEDYDPNNEHPEGDVEPRAALGQAFTYQGQLRNAGVPVNGDIHLRFSLWDDSAAGTQLGSTLVVSPVAATDGLFTVNLDFGMNLLNGDARWLLIEVCDDGTCASTTPLTPRQHLSPVPHALALPGLFTQQNATSPNVIGGRADNAVTADAVGATIGGGGAGGSNNNRATENYATVGGGRNNQAGNNNGILTDANYSTVGGGDANSAANSYATVAGGRSNSITQAHATIGGGRSNQVSAQYGTIAGGGPSDTADVNGTRNRVTDQYGSIGGGGNNQAGDSAGTVSDRPYATVSGGENNVASGAHSSVGGGNLNAASGSWSTIGGGYVNTSSGNRTTVSGGEANTASGSNSAVSGGGTNTASGNYSTIGGGNENIASGLASTVPGGVLNEANGNFSLAAGRRAKASHDGSIVLADSTDTDFASTAPNQLLVRATGGVGIGTDSPTDPLTVNGTVRSISGGFKFPDGTMQTTAAAGEISGSGTVNAIPKFTGATSLGNSTITELAGNVGIGTIAPSYPLHVTATSATRTIFGENTATTGHGYGVYGKNASPGGAGVYGAATYLSEYDNTVGVVGESYNDGGTGVLGLGDLYGVNGFSAEGIGVYGVAYGTGFAGVYGFAASSTGVTYGVYGRTASETGYAGYFAGPNGSMNYFEQMVGIGRTPVANLLEVGGNASKATAGSWLANSDRRIKKEIEPLHGALEALDKVRLVSFRYSDDYLKTHPFIEDRAYHNVIAQEFAEVFPGYVKSSGEKLASGDEILQVDSYPLTIYTAAAVQELNQKLREKDRQIADLTARLERLESALGALDVKGAIR